MGIITYLKETKAELSNVTWPSKKQAAFFTVLVIVISVVVAYLLGFFDFLFSSALESLLS